MIASDAGVTYRGGMDVYLTTERLTLRWFTPDDLDLVIELDSDPQVKRYIDGGLPVDHAEVADHLEWWLTHYPREAGYGFWAALAKPDDAFIGWFHFRPGDGAGPLEPELGYRLRRDSWGKGYGTEASAALIDHGFRELGIERAYAQTMAINIGSRRVMEKAGMRLVREFVADWPVRIDGDEHGDVEYSITRAEWEATQTVPPGNG